MKEYFYVGSKDLLELVGKSRSVLISNVSDLLNWLKKKPIQKKHQEIIATFTVDLDENLWIADRNSEHVVCAKGEKVKAAGEITFAIENNNAEITEVTNQSTGYCPELESWKAVDIALKKTGISYPNFFTTAFEFRKCESCNSTNVIKEEIYICSVCGNELSINWNYDK